MLSRSGYLLDSPKYQTMPDAWQEAKQMEICHSVRYNPVSCYFSGQALFFFCCLHFTWGWSADFQLVNVNFHVTFVWWRTKCFQDTWFLEGKICFLHAFHAMASFTLEKISLWCEDIMWWVTIFKKDLVRSFPKQHRLQSLFCGSKEASLSPKQITLLLWLSLCWHSMRSDKDKDKDWPL